MQCFGDILKVPVFCIDTLNSHTDRFASTFRKNEILFTESANLVSRYEIGHQVKMIQSWSFDELDKLYAPIVSYHSPETKVEHFVAVHSCNSLNEWCLDESNELKKFYSKSLQNRVICLISFPKSTKFLPIVVFSNGCLAFLNKIKSECFDENKNYIDATEKIVGIESHIVSKNTVVLYYIVSNKRTDFNSVYKINLDKNSSEPSNELEKLILKKRIDSWTFMHSNDCLIGAAKVENKIEIYSLEPSIKNSEQIQTLYSFDSPSFELICSMKTCSNGAICLLGKKSENEDLYCVEVYETHYSTKIGKLTLNEAILTEDFCSINDRLLLTTKNNIIIIPIVKQKALLSQLLTKSLSEVNGNKNIKIKNNKIIKSHLGINDAPITLKKIKFIEDKFNKIVNDRQEDIPEEILAWMFDFLTSNYLDIHNNQDKIDNAEDILSHLKNLFRVLVTLPFNELFLVSCLKLYEISFEQYLISIELLLQMFPCQECSIITWISALLDTNFSKFVIKPSKKALEILNRINENNEKNIKFYQDLGPIKTLFDSVVKREQSVLNALSNEITNVGQYSIELLSFT